MKKAITRLLVLVVVIAVAGAAYVYFLAPEKAFCYQLANLCEGGGDAVDACEDAARQVGETKPDAIREAAHCVAGADTCLEAVGCGVGVGLDVGTSAVGEFLQGVERALD